VASQQLLHLLSVVEPNGGQTLLGALSDCGIAWNMHGKRPSLPCPDEDKLRHPWQKSL
jgi:hypothetical protein